MTPNFALSLSQDGIELLHRTSSGGWASMGRVAVNAADLADRLAELRQTAETLEPGGLATALVIPDSEIRYLTLHAPGRTPDERRSQIEAALEGVTPYPVEELAFDWCGEGAEVQVAAIARDTMDEAEDFAVGYGFNPVTVVAWPGAGQFDGEANFGPTQHAVEAAEAAEAAAAAAALSAPDEPPAGVDIDQADADPEAAANEVAAAPLVRAVAASPAEETGPGTDPDVTPAEAEEQAEPEPAPARPAIAGFTSRRRLTLAPVAGGESPADEVEAAPEPVAEPAPEPDPAPEPEPAAAPATPTPAAAAPRAGPPASAPASRRLGLLVTLGLLVVLALVAVWSYLGPTENVADHPPEPAATGIARTAPEAEPEPAAAAAPAPAGEIAARSDAEGPAIGPPPDPDAESEDVHIATADREIRPEDPVVLPDYGDGPGEARLSTPLPPPPADTTYEVDERGLVVATREGVVTPDGIPVFGGRPSIAPPPAPRRAAAEPEAEAEAPNPLAGKRARPRPPGLAERAEIAELGGRTRAALSVLRPRARPEVPPEVSIALAVSREAPDGEAADSPRAAAPEEAPDLDNATRLAVAASLTPRHRPGNFSDIVGAARRTAPAAVAPSTAVPSGPILPSRASVTRRATDENAIRLNRVNLIGVYGTPSNRRALVRLPSGRYVKVEIGDRVDGGRVAAIGDDSLRYVKGGRNITLKLPQDG